MLAVRYGLSRSAQYSTRCCGTNHSDFSVGTDRNLYKSQILFQYILICIALNRDPGIGERGLNSLSD